MPSIPAPPKTVLDASTAAIMMGITVGRKSKGSMTSLARVFTAMAAKTVPTVVIPKVDRMTIGISNGIIIERLNRMLKMGNTASSTMSMKIRLDNILPKKIVSRLVGANRT